MTERARSVSARCAGRGVVSSAAFTAIALTACIDFVEPDLPDRGAPAVLEATVRVSDGSRLDVNARLAPGFDAGGLRRRVSRPALRVTGRDVSPDSVLRNGTFVYATGFDIVEAGAGAVVVEAPVVEDLAQLPVVRWFPAQRIGPSTFDLVRGEDLVLTITVPSSQSEPRPPLQQWTVSLEAADARFTVGASGVPPDSIVIPDRWIPAGINGEIQVRLVYQQATDLRNLPGDYLGLVTLDTRISWVVRSTQAEARRLLAE